MKKLVSIILCSLIAFLPVSAEDIGLSARVGVANQSPEFLAITPLFEPIVLWQQTIQAFSFQIKDNEWDSVSYTITPQYGAVSNISGTITDITKLQNGTAFINFLYLASSDNADLGSSVITLTLNDGINSVVTEQIDIFTF